MTDRERLVGIVKSSLIKHIDKSCCLAENIVDDLLTEGVTTLPIAFSDNRRERMIELLGGYYEETGINIVHYFTDEESEMLADYILSDGWIRPPCRLNQQMWIIEGRKIEECKVSSLTQKSDGSFKIRLTLLKYKSVFEITADKINKTVFLTLEEAEKALAERKGKECLIEE